MYRILIVEDELTVRRGIVMTTPWSEYDCKVIGEAENGAIGLEMIQKLEPDIVITDIKMPEMSGLEMMESYLEFHDTVFIVLTAFDEFDYVQKALKMGAADYILKPFKDEEFIEALNNAKSMVQNVKIITEHNELHQNELVEGIDRYLSKSKHSKHENILKVMTYIHENYSQDVNITSAANMLGVSESYLSRLFREETSYSFHEYLTIYRIKQACQQLMDPNIKIYEVAQNVGYRDQRYFSIVFKKYMGVTPGYYKENILH